MFKKTKVCKGLMLAFGGSLALSVLPALAQQAAQLDRVEVTGSSIKRLAAEQSLPVTVIKAEDLAKAGVSNAEQAMSFIASNQSSITTTTSVGASTGGAANADLRGLGASRTLVLVNGKRMVNNPYLSNAVDLNALPFGAVERIEVLSDGASAIYGSDAIAGVINFITRKEYTGIGLSADASLPTASGDGKAYNAGITGGIGSLSEQGWNVFGGFSWHKQNALAATDRDFAKTAYIPEKGVNKTSGTTFPGELHPERRDGDVQPEPAELRPAVLAAAGRHLPLRLRSVHQHHPGAGTDLADRQGLVRGQQGQHDFARVHPGVELGGLDHLADSGDEPDRGPRQPVLSGCRHHGGESERGVRPDEERHGRLAPDRGGWACLHVRQRHEPDHAGVGRPVQGLGLFGALVPVRGQGEERVHRRLREQHDDQGRAAGTQRGTLAEPVRRAVRRRVGLPAERKDPRSGAGGDRHAATTSPPRPAARSPSCPPAA